MKRTFCRAKRCPFLRPVFLATRVLLKQNGAPFCRMQKEGAKKSPFTFWEKREQKMGRNFAAYLVQIMSAQSESNSGSPVECPLSLLRRLERIPVALAAPNVCPSFSTAERKFTIERV